MTEVSEYIRADDLLAQDALIRGLGEGIVDTSFATRSRMAEDALWRTGIGPLAAISPRTSEEVSRAMTLATNLGLSVVPRGNGTSSTRGCLPDRTDAVVMMAKRLTCLRNDAASGTVVVGAGTNWAELEQTLIASGMRISTMPPAWMGRCSIGGVLSRGIGSLLARDVVGVDLVLADGSVSTYGADKSTEALGNNGLEQALGDNGALGFKTSATLTLARVPKHSSRHSYTFESIEDMLLAQDAALDFLQNSRSTGLGTSQTGTWALNLVAEADYRSDLEAQLSALDSYCGKWGGKRTRVTMPACWKLAGERQAVALFHFPTDKAAPVAREIATFVSEEEHDLVKRQIGWSLQTTGYEGQMVIEFALGPSDNRAPSRQLPDQLLTYVMGIRGELCRRLAMAHAVPGDIGRDPTWRHREGPAGLAHAKRQLDPRRLMNPGAHGFL